MIQGSSAVKSDKVLRIGIGRGGGIVAEYKFKEEDVLLGSGQPLGAPSEFSPELLEGYVLFKREGDQYVLNMMDGMVGRAKMPNGPVDLGVLAKGMKEHPRPLALTEESSGRVIIGDTTYYFQFVVPPPSSLRPPRPAN